jgi:selenocysteine-specific elongation factor
VRAYIGSAEILGTLVFDAIAADALELRAQLHLREPVVAFGGSRFVVRRPSPMTLLGGGYVEGVDVAPIDERRSPEEEAVLAVLRQNGLEALELGALASGANLRESSAREAVERLVERAEAIRVARPLAYVEGAAAQALLARVLAALETAHAKEPWAMGVTSLALSRLLGVSEPTLVRVAEDFENDGRILRRSGYYSLAGHRPALTVEQRTFFDYLVPIDETQPLLPIPFAGAAAAVKLSHVAGLAKAFDTLLAQGTLVKVGENLYCGVQIAQIRQRIEAHFRDRERMTAAQFRDLLGTSRKYAMPLLEWLDTHDVTIRDGDYRTLRARTVI